MAEERSQRRLAAILAADVVGYSRLMEQDEAGTMAVLKCRRQEVLKPLVARHQGRIFKVTGDGVLVEFGSAVNAVQCAIDLQDAMAAGNADLPTDRHIVLRVGVNLGDVVVEGTDLYGDGVNIAARLEAIAEAGGILVSGTAYDHIKNKVSAGFEDLGAQTLKNIADPIRVYRITGTPRLVVAAPNVTAGRFSIAVLPFTSMSGDVEQQYFGDGITEDIITELSRFHQLHVVARNSSFRYRKDVDMVRVGRDLGVQYLVEGSVRRLGDRVRITAQLVDARSGNHLWAERFDRNEEEIFAVQDQVVRTIVATLVGRMRATGLELAKRKPPASLEAYECVLRGDALPVGLPEPEAEARHLFARAIELDPTYARAYAFLAYHLGLKWWRELSGTNDELDQGLELAQKAVALDENDSECQNALGWIYLLRKSHDRAEYHYRRAFELNQNRAPQIAERGILYIYLGMPTEALNCLQDAKLIDPYFEPDWYWRVVGLAHFIARRYDEAIANFGRSSRMPMWEHAYLAACCAQTNKLELAKHQAVETVRLAPNFSLIRFAEMEPFKHSTDRQHLIDGLRKAGLPE
jgi:TolB-like protein/class 3 adenylate cyclase